MIYPTLPIHSAPLSKLPQNVQKLLAQSGHTCAALDKVLVPATGPITIGPNATLTQQAVRSLPTINGGKGSTKGLSPATKAILRSPNRMTPKKDQNRRRNRRAATTSPLHSNTKTAMETNRHKATTEKKTKRATP